MEVNTIYKTPEGETHKILMFDELNRMVYINILGTKHKWVHENEYSKWVVNDTGLMPNIHIPDIPAQMDEAQAAEVGEVALPKKTRKKKTEE